VVIVLSVLIFQSNCTIDSLFVILLALLNDLTMTPIAHDNAHASKKPEQPSISKLFGLSALCGLVASVQSLVFFYLTDSFHTNYLKTGDESCYPLGSGCVCDGDRNRYVQTVMYLQISVSAELMIFAVRTPGWMIFSRPSTALFILTQGASILMSVLCAFGVFGDNTKLRWQDVGVVWAYDIAFLFVLDALKVFYNKTFEGTVETIDVNTPREQILKSATHHSTHRSTACSSVRSTRSGVTGTGRSSNSGLTIYPRRRNLATGCTFMHRPALLASKAVQPRRSAFN